jgi:hypothetical protein
MTADSKFAAWFAAARADAATRAVDPMLEQRLLDRVRELRALKSIAAARPAVHTAAVDIPWWRRWTLVVPVALAGVLLMLSFARPPAAVDTERAAAPAATPFFALAGIEAIAAERAPLVVSSHVPRTALVDYGLPVDPGRADEPVEAEFLLSRAGVVLAVRFRE